jgi:hypothetical protein
MTTHASPSRRSRSEDTARDRAHERPEGASDLAVEAAGKMSEAFEWLERARGHLYDFHHLIGRADFLMGDAADLLDECGAPELADEIRREVIGRNVIDGRWTFQLVEEFDEVYFEAAKSAERRVRDTLMDGRRHVLEAELKDRRRTPGLAAHASRPPHRAVDR